MNQANRTVNCLKQFLELNVKALFSNKIHSSDEPQKTINSFVFQKSLSTTFDLQTP